MSYYPSLLAWLVPLTLEAYWATLGAQVTSSHHNVICELTEVRPSCLLPQIIREEAFTCTIVLHKILKNIKGGNNPHLLLTICYHPSPNHRTIKYYLTR